MRQTGRPALPSSWSHATRPAAASTSDSSSPHGKLGRHAGLHVGGSEFTASSTCSGNAINAFQGTAPPFKRPLALDAATTPPSSGRTSPFRRVSPEVARRAAIFGDVRSSPAGDGTFTSSPTRSSNYKSQPTEAQDLKAVSETHSVPAPFPSLQSPATATDDEHLREAKPAGTAARELRAHQEGDKYSDRPIIYEVGTSMAVAQGYFEKRRLTS